MTFQPDQLVFIIPSAEIGETGTQFQVAYFNRHRTGKYEEFADVLLLRSGTTCVVHRSELIPVVKRETWHADTPKDQLSFMITELGGDGVVEEDTLKSALNFEKYAKEAGQLNFVKEIQELLPFLVEPRFW